LYYNLIEAFKNERQKYYENSADYYIKVYEKLKDKNPHFSFHHLRNKIVNMKYLEAKKYNDEKDYPTAIDKIKEFIDNKRYFTNNNMNRNFENYYWIVSFVLGKMSIMTKIIHTLSSYLKKR
jgi:hypothetical protein